MISPEQTNHILLTAPQFVNNNVRSVVTKVQPFRVGGLRLEHEMINDKHIFHNYGHGSSGVSLAYGSAYLSVKSLFTYVNVDRPVQCAIVGSGLIALLTAIELSKKNMSVTIYADKFPRMDEKNISKKLASQVDDGLWLPFGYDMTDRLKHELLSKISYDYYKQCIKTSRYQSFKVATVYARDTSIKELKEKIPSFIYNGYKNVTINFGNGYQQPYIKMRTFKIDTELFLEELRLESVLRGVKFVEKKFASLEDVTALKESCIFNCTGYSSKYLFNDEQLAGTTGHLIIFNNPDKLDYSICAQLKSGMNMRVHCYGDKIILRSQTFEKANEEFVKNLMSEASSFFRERTAKAKL